MTVLAAPVVHEPRDEPGEAAMPVAGAARRSERFGAVGLSGAAAFVAAVYVVVPLTFFWRWVSGSTVVGIIDGIGYAILGLGLVHRVVAGTAAPVAAGSEIAQRRAPTTTRARRLAALVEPRRFLLARATGVGAGAAPATAHGAALRVTERFPVGTAHCVRVTQVDDEPRYELSLPASPEPGSPRISIPLSPDEHAALAALPATELAARRSSAWIEDEHYVVDEYEGPLAGLVIATATRTPGRIAARVAAPSVALAEVTGDTRFQPDQLATLPTVGLAELLEDVLRR